ncbi:hypothetical protein QT327_03145 [Olivibacter sp. 47]|uniref:hypothetical protein n=1 Tax=Olivibacter sp. 47 TaxID=3056486 RepID=UPI0025A3C0E9|nr:hypothetical protein [Olivibacter sp. 47]MDM8173361.1 hypothetical protein [Olivibacter sp. 47]
MFCLLNVYVFSYGQDTTAVRIDEPKQKADSTFYQYDISDLIRNIIHPKRKPDSLKKKSGITPMPNIAYNPSIGAQIGIKAVAGKVLGNDPNTLMSVAATSASITTKGIITFT